MDPLKIVTQVDLSGANQLASGVQDAMSKVGAAGKEAGAALKAGAEQAAVAQAQLSQRMKQTAEDIGFLTSASKAQVEALKTAYLEYGDAAAAGSEEAIAKLGEQEGALAATKASLADAKREMRDLAAAQAELSVTQSKGLPTVGQALAGAAGGATDEQIALAAANQDLNDSAVAASAALGALASQEGILREQAGAAAQQVAAASGLQQLATREANAREQAAIALAASEEAEAQAAMVDAQAWREVFSAQTAAAASSEALGAASRSATGGVLAAAEAAKQQSKEAKNSFEENRLAYASFRSLAGLIAGGGPGSLVYGLASAVRGSGALATALAAAFPLVGAIALIDILSQLPNAIQAAEDALLGFGETAQKVFTDRKKEIDAMIAGVNRLSERQAGIATAGLEGTQRGAAQISAQKDLNAGLEKQYDLVRKASEQINKFKELQEQTKYSVATTGLATAATGVGPSAADLERLRGEYEKQQTALHDATSAASEYWGTMSAKAKAFGIDLPDVTSAVEQFNKALTTKDPKQIDALYDASRKAEQQLAIESKSLEIAITGDQRAEAAERIRIAAEAAQQRLSISAVFYTSSTALAKAAYEQGRISVQSWLGYQQLALQQAQAEQLHYFETVSALYRSDPEKEAKFQAEQLRATYEAMARTSEELASEQKRLQATFAEYTAELLRTDGGAKEYQTQMEGMNDATRGLLDSLQKLREAERELQRARQEQGFSERESQIRVAAASRVDAEDYVRTRLVALYREEYEAAIQFAGQQKEKQLATIADTTSQIARVKSEIAAAASEGVTPEQSAAYTIRLRQLEAELADEKAAYQKAGEDELAIREKYDNLLVQARIAAIKQEQEAVQGFDQQSVNSLNQFVVTVATTTGEVNGRVNELWYIGQQWRRMMLQMEQDFLHMVLKVIEDSALFHSLEGKFQSIFNSIFAHIGLGAQLGNFTAVGAPGAQIPLFGGTGAATAASQAATTAPATAAFTQLAAVTQAASVAQISHTAATAAGTGATVASTGATGAHVAATTGDSAATSAHTVTLFHSIGAFFAHIAAVFSSIAAFIAHAVAVAGDTAALIAHKIVAFFTGLAGGGLVHGPGTSTSDSVPIAASTGEFVVRAKSVQEPGVLSFLHELNRGGARALQPQARYAEGGIVAPLYAHFAEGGIVESLSARQDAFGGGGTHAPASSSSTVHLAYHDNRELSAVDTHGLVDLLQQDSRGAADLVQSLVRRGLIDPRSLMP